MFEETVRVNNVYNRLVMYEGTLFHGANKFFGEEDRLIQLFYVNSMQAPSFPIQRVREYL